jgi:hypothetical protein
VSTSTQPTSPTPAPSHRPRRSTAARRFAGIALFALIAIACAQPELLKLPFVPHERFAETMTIQPDAGGWFPNYPAFLDDVRNRTMPGDAIALVVPPRTWDDGYSYAYYRASYFLAGREVLPVIDEAGRPLPQNFARARSVAVWRMPPPRGWRVAWHSHGGALLVR